MDKIYVDCKIPKNINQFAIHGKQLKEKCNVCLKRYMSNHYQNNKQKYIDYTINRGKVTRAWYLEYKDKLKCKECGENHPAVLDFHHRDPNEKVMSIGNIIGRKWSIDKILNEMNKCDILCSNCHRKLHWDLKQ